MGMPWNRDSIKRTAAACAALLACATAAASTDAGLPAPARERSLPGISQGKFPPVVSKSRPPIYPAEARQLGQQGRVMVRALVDTQGQVAYAEIKESSGHPLLDQAALATVRSWSFTPGTRNGVPEAMWARIPINYALDGRVGR